MSVQMIASGTVEMTTYQPPSMPKKEMFAPTGGYQPVGDLQRVYAGTQVISMSHVTLRAVRGKADFKASEAAVGAIAMQTPCHSGYHRRWDSVQGE